MILIRIILFIIILCFSKVAVSQEIVYLEQYYRFSFNNDTLLGKVVFIPKGVKFKELWTLSYSKDWKKNALDSAQRVGGNVIKVEYHKKDGVNLTEKNIEKIIKYNSAGYVANIYRLNENNIQLLKDSLKKLEPKIAKIERLNLLLSTHLSDEEIEKQLYRQEIRKQERLNNKLQSLKDIEAKRLYLVGNVGLDYILQGSIGLQTELNFLKNNNFDIGVGNKVNGMFGFALIFQNYTYLYTKIRIGKIWVQPGFGREYVTGSFAASMGKFNKNNRFDLDVSWRNKNSPNVGFIIPIRIKSDFVDFPFFGFYVRHTLFLGKN